LERGVDATKDQSYFLYRIPADVLGTLLFPLGDLRKTDVRKMAEERGLPVAGRRESQDVCFTDDRLGLVRELRPDAFVPGPIEDRSGRALGTHRGIAHYTVGQRKGLGIGGPEGPYRVVEIDATRNAVVVGAAQGEGTSRVVLAEPVWRLEDGVQRVWAQVRYRATPKAAAARLTDAGLEVTFDSPVELLAPGQSVVLFDRDRVLGGGIVPR
jgi:tRNA-specific 2-thiouridylase